MKSMSRVSVSEKHVFLLKKEGLGSSMCRECIMFVRLNIPLNYPQQYEATIRRIRHRGISR